MLNFTVISKIWICQWYWNSEICFAEFCPIYSNKREEIRQNDILTKTKLTSFPSSLKKPKICLTWFSLKISSDGGDFRRIIEIALFRNYSTEILLFKSILHSCQLVFYFISRQRKCLRTVSSCILYWSSATRIWKNLLTESLTSHPPHTWISYSRRWKGCNISIISTLL